MLFQIYDNLDDLSLQIYKQKLNNFKLERIQVLKGFHKKKKNIEAF